MPQDVQQLIVLGSTVTALAVVRDAHRIGLRCTVIDTERGPASLSRYAEFRLVGANDDDAVVATVQAISGETPSALIADSDRWLRWLHAHRGEVDAACGAVLHASNDVLEICLQKSRFIRWCQDRGFPVPALYETGDGDDLATVDYPVLVRPESTRHGAGGDLPKAVEISDEAQLADLLARYRQAGAIANVCQSLLRPNLRQYSVGIARNHGGESRILVAEKCRPSADKCAGGTYVVTKPAAEVEALALRVVDRINYFGIAELEVVGDDATGELFILELNARPWVQYALAPESGFDFLTFLLRPGQYESSREQVQGKRWISFGDDLYVVFSRSEGMLQSGEIAISAYLQTVARANVWPIFSPRDPVPWVKSIVTGFNRLIRRS